MKGLKKILSAVKQKNTLFRKRIEGKKKTIKIRFNSDWFYNWFDL